MASFFGMGDAYKAGRANLQASRAAFWEALAGAAGGAASVTGSALGGVASFGAKMMGKGARALAYVAGRTGPGMALAGLAAVGAVGGFMAYRAVNAGSADVADAGDDYRQLAEIPPVLTPDHLRQALAMQVAEMSGEPDFPGNPHAAKLASRGQAPQMARPSAISPDVVRTMDGAGKLQLV